MKTKIEKTNVMRLLEAKNVTYISYEYDPEITDGMKVAVSLNENPDRVFKTLVTVANTLEYLVYVIPVNETLNLKKAAKAANVKSVEMIKQKELLPLTGYVHGGCSPIGMKKKFRTFVNDTAELFDTIIFSAGKKGYQVETSLANLILYTGAASVDLT